MQRQLAYIMFNPQAVFGTNVGKSTALSVVMLSVYTSSRIMFLLTGNIPVPLNPVWHFQLLQSSARSGKTERRTVFWGASVLPSSLFTSAPHIPIVFQTFEKCFVSRLEGMCGVGWIGHHTTFLAFISCMKSKL